MTDNDHLPARKPLTPEQMQALVKPAEELAAQLFTNAGTEQGIRTAFDAFLSTGLMKVLKDEVVGEQVLQWAKDRGIELPEAPEPDAVAAPPRHVPEDADDVVVDTKLDPPAGTKRAP